MRRWVATLVLPMAVALALAGCGTKSSSTTPTPGSSDSMSAGATGAASACPSTPQGTLVKTRFAVDIGLIIGTTKHFIYNAYTQGKFAKGAHGRIAAIVKAGLAAAAVLHLTHNAIRNAKADPLLCKALIQPLTTLSDALSGLKSKLFSGDLTAVTNLGGTVTSIESAAKGQGMSVVSGLIPGLK